MKKILVLTALIAVASVIFIGCSLFGSKTVAYDVSSTSGFCVEITTSNNDIITAAENAGYTEGACSSDDRLGTCADYVAFEGESFSAYFYSTSGLTAETAEMACEMMDGTWTAE